MSALMSPGPGPLETGSYGEGTSVTLIELETNLREDFTITEKGLLLVKSVFKIDTIKIKILC